MMREVMELESDEICKELAITSNNLWVILYRARMALRECLREELVRRRGRRAMIRRALGHLLRCKDVSRLVSQGEDRPLSRWERCGCACTSRLCDGARGSRRSSASCVGRCASYRA